MAGLRVRRFFISRAVRKTGLCSAGLKARSLLTSAFLAEVTTAAHSPYCREHHPSVFDRESHHFSALIFLTPKRL